MSRNGKSRAPLVADKRTQRSAKTAAKPKSRRKSASRRKPARQRNGLFAKILGAFGDLLRFVLRIIWGLTWRGGVIVSLLIAMAVGYYATTLPEATALVDGRARGSVTLLDREGDVFAWRGDQFGGIVTAESVSPHLKHAVVATEDKRFYLHPGIDPRGIASAIKINLRAGRGPLSGNGGSTITQQTAKLLCLGDPYDPDAWESEAAYEADCRRTTLWRKAKEAVYAMAMEVRYTKNEVLTIYLNRAYLGAGTRGFEAAAQRYFGKSASEVGAAEAAMLAGLLKAPTTYAPTNNLERSRDRASIVIGLMNDQGYLSNDQAQIARTNPATLSKAAERRAGGYFADWVMESGPEFFTRDTTEDVIIQTTLDQAMQKAAEDAMKRIFEEKLKPGSEAQAAIVVMSADGAVRAMVGGRDTTVAGAFNRATMANRQPGSAFKPFIYAAALDLGLSPDDILDDSPLTLNIPGSGPWTPQNYDRKFRGPVTLTHALRDSLNIPAVRLSEKVGRETTRTVASMFGIESDLALGPALALGASESTLLEMTGAYAGILNGGSSVTPYGLIQLRLQGESEPLMDNSSGGIGERVIQRDAAEQLVWMMHKVVEEGTGQRARLPGREAAGKTGTTQAARDAWFIGFTADYVAGVWMGYDNNTPLTGVTGGGLPADIWREAMIGVHQDLPPTPLPMQGPAAPAYTAPAQTQSQGSSTYVGAESDGFGGTRRQPSRTAEEEVERVLIDMLEDLIRGN
ncbi:transglycosylase domain-containing protein [Aestuariibius insulae]|uniref:transglycosylase domain-containing protein n=1 Tax=Aestuariibius insulae TaxID=2058287 RepID=UPI00345F0C78